MLAACSPEFFVRVAFGEKTITEQSLSQRCAGRFDEFADNHAGPRSYRGAAVWNQGSIRLGYFDHIKSDAERLSGNLAKDGIGALAHFGTRGQHSDPAFVGSFHGNN